MKSLTLAISLLLAPAAFAGSAPLPTPDEARTARPDIAQYVDELAPARNRAGQFYIPGSWTATPEGQALLLERFLSGTDTGELRVALAYSLDSSHFFSWTELQSETDPKVRAALLHLAKSQGGEKGADLVRSALSDPSDWVRSEAARLAGYLPSSPATESALLATLQDAAPAVRGLSARSLGWHRVAHAFDEILPLLGDAEPEVVDHALKALAKLDLSRTQDLEHLSDLTASPYARIADTARRIQASK